MSLRMLTRTMLGAILGATMVAGVAAPAHADRDDRCRREIRKAEQNLEKEVRRHGEGSRGAEKRRRELEEKRERCHMRGDEHHDERR
jgi:hypothetical protein